uniref:DUF5641 domain-containing protein n=1 Tax=Megaselia scalaris TaxID=36166 RepID=T1GQ18_MEGSC
MKMLEQLQQRRKWKEKRDNVKPGDLVLVEDHALPSYKYPLPIRPIKKLCTILVLDDYQHPAEDTTMPTSNQPQLPSPKLNSKKLEVNHKYSLRSRI